MSADAGRAARWQAIRDGSASEHDWRNWCALCESERIRDAQRNRPDPVDEAAAELDAAEYRRSVRFLWTLGVASVTFTVTMLALGFAALSGAFAS